MSHRYRMVPASEVVAMPADQGFRPVLASQPQARIPGTGDVTRHPSRCRHPKVIHASDRAIEDAPRSLEKVAARKPIGLAPPRREAFAATAPEVRDAATEVTPAQVLARAAWRAARAASNAVQNIVRGRSANTGKAARTRAIGSFGEDVRINRALWALAERMARLVG